MDPLSERPQHICQEFIPRPRGGQGTWAGSAQDISQCLHQGSCLPFVIVIFAIELDDDKLIF